MKLRSHRCVGGIHHGRVVVLPLGASQYQCAASRRQPYEAWRGVWGLPKSSAPYVWFLYEVRENPKTGVPYLGWKSFA